MDVNESVVSTFKRLFGETPLVVRSPGRVNLIGEHTDYNDGYVLPAAIDRAMYFAIAPSGGNECRVYALDMNAEHRFVVDRPMPSDKHWPNYLMGVVDQLNNAGYHIGGFNCVFGGDIPIGAGMSSSAALEAGLAFALNQMFRLNIEPLTLVKLAQKAENEFVGVQCGVMDQYINIFGVRGSALRIDCRTLKSERVSFPQSAAIVLFDSGVAHSLKRSEYNTRRAECSAGVTAVKQKHPAVSHLRDVSIAMLTGCKDSMDQVEFRRCKYVVEENDRVLAACAALARNDLVAFGALLYESHEGLRREYEVSCAELDCLVDAVRTLPGVYGARMMGGGFGGCTINLIQPDAVERVSAVVREEYAKAYGREMKAYVTAISEGTDIIVP